MTVQVMIYLLILLFVRSDVPLALFISCVHYQMLLIIWNVGKMHLYVGSTVVTNEEKVKVIWDV